MTTQETVIMYREIAPKPKLNNKRVRFECTYHALQALAKQFEHMIKTMKIIRTSNSSTCVYPPAYAEIMKYYVQDYMKIEGVTEIKAYTHFMKDGFTREAQSLCALSNNPMFASSLPNAIARNYMTSNDKINLMKNGNYPLLPSMPLDATPLAEAFQQDLNNHPALKPTQKVDYMPTTSNNMIMF